MWGCQGILHGPQLATGLAMHIPPSSSVSRNLSCQHSRSRGCLIVDCREEDLKANDREISTATTIKVSAEAKRTPTSAPPPSPANSAVPLSVGSASAEENADSLLHPISVEIPYGNRLVILETGLIGRQANGSVTITDGETILYTSVCAVEDLREPSDFAALTVHYQERFSAAGRTSGGFFKREVRAKDHEILVCRLIDRPLRPMIAKGFTYETQILSWVLSYDGLHSPEPLAITAAGAALAISDIPLSKAVAAVRVGMINGQFVINPTVKEMELSKLDMILAGTADAVIMIEGYCEFLTEEELLQAISMGQDAVSKVCHGIEELVEKAGKPQRISMIQTLLPELVEHIHDLAEKELLNALQIQTKRGRKDAIGTLEKKLLYLLTKQSHPTLEFTAKSQGEVLVYEEDQQDILNGELNAGGLDVKSALMNPIKEHYDPMDVKVAFKDFTSRLMRKLIIENRKRSDGRGVTEIRRIQCSCGLLPRAHGSSLFTRGETQALAVATLGGDDMGQRLDNLTDRDIKRFYFQYTFPPSSVGETGRVGAPSRREIGHGMLAERSLEPALPSEREFPYTIRVESTITESNGSSSMASVCGGCLAMLDAGVPLKCPIAGVAMGLILNSCTYGGDVEPIILSDIIGTEDALGDMDFKVAGSEVGITAFQMDIKVEGININVLEKALTQAKEARCQILGEMTKCKPQPTRTLSKYAPLIELTKIEPEKVNILIGTGGKTIRSVIEHSGVDSIDVEDDGSVRILARSIKSLESAKSRIMGLTMDPLIGTVYRDCVVKSIVSFGCFLEIAPGREGLCHISELSTKRLPKVQDFVNIGDRLDVKLIEVNARGQLRLSHRAVLLEGQQQIQEIDANRDLATASSDV